MGNSEPHQLVSADDGTRSYEPLAGPTQTQTAIPDGYPLTEVFLSVTLADGIWDRHSATTAPSWVSSDLPMLAELLASHYGCDVRPLTKETP